MKATIVTIFLLGLGIAQAPAPAKAQTISMDPVIGEQLSTFKADFPAANCAVTISGNNRFTFCTVEATDLRGRFVLPQIPAIREIIFFDTKDAVRQVKVSVGARGTKALDAMHTMFGPPSSLLDHCIKLAKGRADKEAARAGSSQNSYLWSDLFDQYSAECATLPSTSPRWFINGTSVSV